MKIITAQYNWRWFLGENEPSLEGECDSVLDNMIDHVACGTWPAGKPCVNEKMEPGTLFTM